MTYLAAAYLVVWTLLFLYLIFLQGRQKKLNDQLRALSNRASARQSGE